MANKDSLVPLKMLLFSFNASNTIIMSFLPLYLKYNGFEEAQIGYILAMGPLAIIFAQPFWGFMSDKYESVKRMLLICIISVIIVSLVFFQMSDITLVMILAGFFYFFQNPIGGLTDSQAQRRANDLNVPFGTIRTWGSIGFAVSSLVVGNILTIFGVQYMIIPYLFFATFSLIVVFRLKDVEGESVPVQLSDIGRLFKNKPFLIFMGLVMFIMVGHRVNDSYMGLYIAELGGTEGLIGIAWFAGVAAEALVFGFANFWFKKYHSLIFMIAAGLVYALRWFLYSWMDSPYGIVGLQILHGVSFGVFYSAAFQYVTGLIPRSMQSTGHLLFFAGFFGITGIIGSLGGGMIMDAFGGETLYFIMGIIAVTGTVLLTIYHILPYGKEIGSTITMPRIRIRRRA